jgi:phage shock protein C
MATERFRGRSGSAEAFDTSLRYDDIEMIREKEQEKERNENDKLSFAGMMALVAGISLLAVGFLGSLIGGGVLEILQTALPVVGFGALGYGFYKTLKLAFRKKELEFPTLNVYRKTKARPRQGARADSRRRASARTETQGEGEATGPQYRTRTRSRTYRRRRQASSSQKKTLSRSRMNRVFSGVAGGIAEYTGVSANLIRFAFIVGMFVTGGFPIVFIYLLLSIVLPPDYDRGIYDMDDGRDIKIR